MRDIEDRSDATGSDDLVVVFETSDISLLRIVKSVLDSGGVPCVVQGETALELLPIRDATVGVGKPPICAVIYVAPELAEQAKTLLDTLQITDGPLKLPDGSE